MITTATLSIKEVAAEGEEQVEAEEVVEEAAAEEGEEEVVELVEETKRLLVITPDR